MRLIYVLLSPTYGMHQYTADLANRAVVGAFSRAGHADVHLVTTAGFPADRYHPGIKVHTPLVSRSTGFSPEGLRLGDLERTRRLIGTLASEQQPAVVHITGVHLWNIRLVQALVRSNIPVVHTLHDLRAHSDVRFGSLIPRWNGLVIRAGAHILVHGLRYRKELIATGLPDDRVTFVPLLHGFWGYDTHRDEAADDGLYAGELDSASVVRQNARVPIVLYFGRVESYKGVDTLLAAWTQSGAFAIAGRLVVAGLWAPALQPPDGLPGVEIRNRRIADHEGVELFKRAALLVLPYRDATQSALIGAAYQFGLPVIVTDTGALPEYVIPGRTGWVVPSGDPASLSSVLREALDDPTRRAQMGTAGREWYEAQRSAETETLMRLYEDLAARSEVGVHRR